jgi:hypothetical protein
MEIKIVMKIVFLFYGLWMKDIFEYNIEKLLRSEVET